MKILLINPNHSPESPWFDELPMPMLGLLSIGAILEREEYDIKLIDAFGSCLNQLEISAEIIKYKPDIVGITTDSLNFFESLRTAKLVKTVSNALVIVGGSHATLRAYDIIKYPVIDVVVIGEGEYTILEIVRRIEKGESLKGCNGCFIKENGIIIKNPLNNRIENLDLLPFPARHLLPFEKYLQNDKSGSLRKPFTTMITSRGCPYNCSFCSSRIIWGNLYKYCNPTLVVDEIELLINNYGIKGISFVDAIFTLNKNHVIKICEEIIRRNIDIDWACSSRANHIDKEMLSKMAKSGCKLIWYGFESGSQRILDKINKKITIDDIRKAVKRTREVDIIPCGLFMVGTPEETMEDINLTINLIRELKLKMFTLNIFTAIPDSEMYYEVKENKLYDSAFGDVLFLKTSVFNRNDLIKIVEDAKKELGFLLQIDNLKRNFLKYSVKYSFDLIIHPKKLKKFYQGLKIYLRKVRNNRKIKKE